MNNLSPQILELLSSSVIISQENREQLKELLPTFSEEQKEALLSLLNDAEKTENESFAIILEKHENFAEEIENYLETKRKNRIRQQEEKELEAELRQEKILEESLDQL